MVLFDFYSKGKWTAAAIGTLVVLGTFLFYILIPSVVYGNNQSKNWKIKPNSYFSTIDFFVFITHGLLLLFVFAVGLSAVIAVTLYIFMAYRRDLQYKARIFH